MKFTLYLDDYETERTYSYLRWIFLFISAFMFYYPPMDNILQFEHETFNTLFIGSLLYMGVSQMIFQRMDSKQYMFRFAIKIAILFDFISLCGYWY
jgi:diguanylate cyclase